MCLAVFEHIVGCEIYINLMLVVLSVHVDSIVPDTRMELGV